MPTKKELKTVYNNNVANYDQVCLIGKSMLREAFSKKNIELLHISYRVKSFDSLFEKVSRKRYTDPYKEIEDICGIRVICFYSNDLHLVGDIIKKAFILNEVIDKSKALDSDRFGYRSDHYIVNLPKQKDQSIGLSKYKIEIQARTVLMHTWAHIQGKLEYKQEDHVPEQFKRSLNQLSAILELADDQFQVLKIEKDALRVSLRSNKSDFNVNSELNIDTFMVFLAVYFPKRKGSYRYSKLLMVELLRHQIGFDKIINNYQLVIDHLQDIENELDTELSREAALKMIFAIADKSFLTFFKGDEFLNRYMKTIKKWRKLVR